jgi:amino acid adenylation domain-containing protein
MSEPSFDPRECSSFVDLLRRQALEQPDRHGYTFLLDGETDEAAMTYGELDGRARAIGAQLQIAGVSGERALLLYPPGLEYIAAFFGCLYAGTVAVPSYPPRLNRQDPRLRAIVADAQPTVVLTNSDIFSSVERRFAHTPELAALRWLATDDVTGDLAGDWRDPGVTGDTLAFLQYTSGSTSAPKGVMVSHGNLIHNSALIQRCFEHTVDSRGVIWLPPYHDMGLIGGILQPLYVGFPVVLMSPVTFLQRPVRWLEAISRYRGTTSGGPNFAYEICTKKIRPEQRETLDLSSWAVAFNGAEPVRHETMGRFTAAFEPRGFRREAFYPCYGLAEATLIVSGGEKADEPVTCIFDGEALERNEVRVASPVEKMGRTLVGCGRALADQKVVIANTQTLAQCPPENMGEIWVAGPSVGQGYWGREEETAQTFGAHLAGTGEGPFLRTGDLGFLKDSELFIAGRIKDLIIIRGRNHYPQDIELTVERSHAALRAGCGAAFSVDVEGEERLVVVQELKRTQRDADVAEVARAVRQAVTEAHELHVHAVVLLRPMSIPKTSSGKIQRRLCRKMYLEDSLRALGSSILEEGVADAPSGPREEERFIRKALAAVDDEAARRALLVVYLQAQAARVLRLSSDAQVDPQRSLGALGLDSLMAVELAHEIEVSLGMVVPMADLLQGPSVADLASRVLAELRPVAEEETASLEPTGDHPLSRGQRALWFLQRLAPQGAAYNLASAVRIEADLDVEPLRRALGRLVERHASLRTTFPSPQGEPVQSIHERVEVGIEEIDASAWEQETLEERLAEEAHWPFDLETVPLMRVWLFRRSEDYVLLLVVHHIVADFWSLAVLARELATLIQAEREGVAASLPPLERQYVDYARQQETMLAGSEGERLWTYWERELSGELPVLNLPTDRARPAVRTYRGASQRLKLDATLTRELEALSRANDSTLYVTLLAAFQVLLHRYTGQDDIIVGSPTAGRERAELRSLVGYFVNPVVLRGDASGNPTFVEFLGRVKQAALEALAHQAYPFDVLVERLQPKRDLSRSPVFDVMFTLQQSPLAEERGLASLAVNEPGVRIELGGLVLESVAVERRAAQLDLVLAVAETGEGLTCSAEYNTDLFESDTIEQLLAHFQALLEGIVSSPEQPIGNLLLLVPAEQEMLARWNDTRAGYEREVCIHKLFEAQAEQTPQEIALTFEDKALTYGELDRRANQLAHHLRGLGVEPGVCVGVCMARSPEMVVALLGVLKAGGAYVPLDPAYPAEWIGYVLEDSGVAVLLVDGAGAQGGKSATMQVCKCASLQVCDVEAMREVVAGECETDLSMEVGAEGLAYVIYTSGSTGRPKGVQVCHRAVVNFLRSMEREPGFTAEDVLLAVTTLSFDIAGLELFLPLVTGGRVHLVSHMVTSDGAWLAAALEACGATVMQATPATWRLLLETGWQGSDRLTVLCGGEAFPRELANQLAEKGAVVWNMYGPTETTIWSSIYRVEIGEGIVPIGRPIANTQLHVLDHHLAPVPVGVWGELAIGGDGLAHGYANRPGMTAERFVPDPFGPPGSRLYRTGDLVRHRRDGNVEFLGRTDHQVKIRGFRIEIGEIEHVLAQHKGVKETVVVAHEDVPGDRRLVAYLVPVGEPAPTVGELRRFLQEKLPDYMVPSAFVTLEALPLTPNGKIDRSTLPAPDGQRPDLDAVYVVPETQLERRIAAAWRDTLQVEKVGIHDNFFELGGHSLLMARIHGRLREEGIGNGLSMVELFQYPTVHALAAHLSNDGASSEMGRERVELRTSRQTSMSEQRRQRRERRTTNRW